MKAVFWSTKMATVICKITAWARKLRWASRKTNIWNWVHATKFLRPSGTNGVKATPSPRRVAMWFISTCVTSARKNCMNVCRSSANWRKRTLASIRLKNRFRYVRPHTTPWAVSKPIRTVKPALKVCSPWVNVPLLVCTVRTVWAPTRWRNWWSSVVWPVSKLWNAHPLPVMATMQQSMLRLLALNSA